MKDSQQGFGCMEGRESQSFKGSKEGLYLFVLICHSPENNCFKQNICILAKQTNKQNQNKQKT